MWIMELLINPFRKNKNLLLPTNYLLFGSGDDQVNDETDLLAWIIHTKILLWKVPQCICSMSFYFVYKLINEVGGIEIFLEVTAMFEMRHFYEIIARFVCIYYCSEND